MILTSWIVNGFMGYLAVGVVFAAFFVTLGAGKIDPDAARGSWGFRVLIFPGSVLLWPLLLLRWRQAGTAREERSPHRLAACRQTLKEEVR